MYTDLYLLIFRLIDNKYVDQRSSLLSSYSFCEIFILFTQASFVFIQ